VLLLYGWLGNLVGSHLLGAFLGGLSFCWMKHHAALNLWHSQVKRIAYWLIRLFFGATVAFSIPITKMLAIEPLWKGVILGLGPCIATKVVAGVFTGDDKWVVGFAMVGRGEFAYLVAQTASTMLLNPVPGSFDTSHLVLQPGGYYCYDGLCANGTTPSANGTVVPHRRLGSAAGADGTVQFCGKDDYPAPHKNYWAVGTACTDHPTDCDCELMMPPDAFSICVWALLLASIMAPVGFGATLRNKLKRAGAHAAAAAVLEMGSAETESATCGDVAAPDKE